MNRKSSIPSNEASIGIKIFVKASELPALERLVASTAYHRAPSEVDFIVANDVLNRVVFAWHLNKRTSDNGAKAAASETRTFTGVVFADSPQLRTDADLAETMRSEAQKAALSNWLNPSELPPSETGHYYTNGEGKLVPATHADMQRSLMAELIRSDREKAAQPQPKKK